MHIRPEHPLDPAEVLRALERAVDSPDADVIDSAILAAFQIDDLRQEFGPVFVRLLGVKNHHKHEDLVSGIQELRVPSAVDALFSAANVRHEYLDYDEFAGLARKCTWALADIGTAEAKAKLESLALHENPLIAGYAKKRLDRWREEQHRKKSV